MLVKYYFKRDIDIDTLSFILEDVTKIKYVYINPVDKKQVEIKLKDNRIAELIKQKLKLLDKALNSSNKTKLELQISKLQEIRKFIKERNIYVTKASLGKNVKLEVVGGIKDVKALENTFS